MRRLTLAPRDDWQKKVESQGLTFHSRGIPYWNDEACYTFAEKEIDTLEKAANDVHELFLEAAQYIVDKDRFKELALNETSAKLITDSWNSDQLHLYGRFDFSYNGKQPPKLLEYNADTPTSLLEAAAIQWYWLEERFPKKDQFNSIHESLIERWRKIGIESIIHFATLGEMEEDVMTTSYLMDTAVQAGLKAKYLNIEEIGYDSESSQFKDTKMQEIKNLFKLYPWEWLVNEEFGKYLPASARFIEPPWKMLFSNKGILPILWELFPGHPNLLPSFRDSDKLGNAWVRKPLLSREGANILISDGKISKESGGEYGEEGFIYQAYAPLPKYSGKHPVLGLWMIGDECRGLGIRESDDLITTNTSRFVPHYFSPEKKAVASSHHKKERRVISLD